MRTKVKFICVTMIIMVATPFWIACYESQSTIGEKWFYSGSIGMLVGMALVPFVVDP